MAWLTIIGMGDDGLAGLAEAHRQTVLSATTLVGGARLLAMIPAFPAQSRLAWTTTEATIAGILAHRPEPVVVVASGDPLHFGIAATLLRSVAIEEMTIHPHPSSFSLAASRLGWPLQDVLCRSVHGRDLSALRLEIQPGIRLLLLLSDGEQSIAVARLLSQMGYGDSHLTALSHLGGSMAGRLDGTAKGWEATIPALSLLAIECRPSHGCQPLSRVTGLPDAAFEHDGQLTKGEVRAITLAALAPLPGEILWDVGAGSGSIAIEWLRAVATGSAYAIERDPQRLDRVTRNAHSLGVPRLVAVAGEAPAAWEGLPSPHAVFIGGGVSQAGVLAAAWHALRPGGRLVANAVSLAGEAALLHFREPSNGVLRRISLERTRVIGSHAVWEPLAPVTQLIAVKP